MLTPKNGLKTLS